MYRVSSGWHWALQVQMSQTVANHTMTVTTSASFLQDQFAYPNIMVFVGLSASFGFISTTRSDWWANSIGSRVTFRLWLTINGSSRHQYEHKLSLLGRIWLKSPLISMKYKRNGGSWHDRLNLEPLFAKIDPGSRLNFQCPLDLHSHVFWVCTNSRIVWGEIRAHWFISVQLPVIFLY